MRGGFWDFRHLVSTPSSLGEEQLRSAHSLNAREEDLRNTESFFANNDSVRPALMNEGRSDSMTFYEKVQDSDLLAWANLLSRGLQVVKGTSWPIFFSRHIYNWSSTGRCGYILFFLTELRLFLTDCGRP